MPKRSGYEVAQWLRWQAWGRDITLIAATGWGQDHDRRRAHDAGFDGHVVMPIDPERLGRRMEDLPARA
jgi:two-component system CheB/CheR fusion protein